MWNLANLLTLSRFIAAPVFLWLILALERGRGELALAASILLVVTLLTDMFDGLAARRQNTVTDFGKIMDPVADSTFFLTALFAFSASDRFLAPVWFPVIVLYREVGMQVLRRYAALSGQVLAARTSGKVKMVLQSVLLCGLLFGITASDAGRTTLSEATIRAAVWWTLCAIAALNILSLPEYLAEIPRLRRTLKESKTRPAPPASGTSSPESN